MGAAIDVASRQLLVFDPETGVQTGVVGLPNSVQASDIAISPEGAYAYVSSFGERAVYVVDMGTLTLAPGLNPIPVATLAEDLVVTSDGKYLVVVDGSGVEPIVVVDTATRTTVSVLNDGLGHSGVDVTPAGDVLVGSLSNSTTRKYSIDSAGSLTFSGQSLLNGGQNVEAAPGGVTAIQSDASRITSFLISDLSSVSFVTPGGNVQSFAFSPDGSKFYVRTSNGIVAYNYDSATGVIGSSFINVSGLAPASGYYGVDQLGVTPDGSRIYVTSGSQVLSFNALNGVFLGAINLPGASFVGLDLTTVSGTGTASGIKYHDVNGDGIRNVDDPGLPGWVIYADLDNDSIRDANEPFTTTGLDGSYTLNLDAGAYTLREEFQSGWIQTSPKPALYTTGSNGTNLTTINPATGVGTIVGSFGANQPTTYAGAFTPDGTFWTIVNSFDPSLSRLAKVNLKTGAATPVGAPNWSGSPIVALEADAAGNLYAGNFNGVFYTIDKVTGQRTTLGSLGFGGVKDFAFDNSGVLWATGGNRLYRVNPASGTTTPGPFITGTNAEVQGIMVDPLTGVFYAATYSGSSQFYTIDVTTGVATPVGAGVGVSSLNGGDFMPLSVNRGLNVFITANHTSTGRDFGNTLDQGTITGTKFNDVDKDGVYDSGELGLPGWTIYADLDQDGIRDANEPFTTTAGDGRYSLNLPSGNYTIREEVQAGWIQTSPLPGLFATGNNGNSLISINPATGVGTVVGPFGANTPTTYAGAFTPDGTFWTITNAFDSSLSRLARVNLATGAATPVGGTNWTGSPMIALEADAAGNLYGANFNGVFYSINKSTGQLTPIGNMGISGVRDLTFDNDGKLWAVSGNRLYRVNPATGISTPGPAISGANAEIQGIMVDPLTGGFYGVTFTANSQYYSINPDTGVATALGTGLAVNSPNGGDFMPLSVNRGISVTVNANQTVSGRNFGNIADVGTVTGTKFNDVNLNGVRDGNEAGLAGWIVYADLDNDKIRDVNEPFTTTGSDGTYALALSSGAYTIREETQAGWVQTSPVPVLLSTGIGGSSLISINSTTGSSTVIGPFGASAPATFAGAFTPDGTFWTITNAFDSSLSRLATVNQLTGAITPIGDPHWSGSPIVALESDAAGNLLAANFNGFLYSINKSTGELTFLGQTGIGGIRDLAFDNAGALWAVAASRLYRVNPANGIAVPGPMITGANAEVQGIMVDPLTGRFYATTFTSGSVLYSLDITTGAATPVSSSLGVPTPNGGDFTPLAANRGHSVNVNAGAVTAGRDFGNILDQGTVTGTKYHDLDGDGVRDLNEPGLSGWVVYADLDNDRIRDVDEPYAATASDGTYALTLASGPYTLREESQSGWVQTAPQPGLFAIGNNGTSLISINPVTGTGAVVGSLGVSSSMASAFSADGTFWTIINPFDPPNSQLATVNLTTGLTTPVGTLNLGGSSITALEANADGKLYGVSFNGAFYSINTQTGQGTFLGFLPIGAVRDLTFDNQGTLWAVTSNQLFQIDPSTVAATAGPVISGVNGDVQGIMVDPLTGVFHAFTNAPNSPFYAVDPVTGLASQIGSGIGTNALLGGDFVPLSANRGITAYVSVGMTTTVGDFGNREANSAPVITSAATVSIPENSTSVITVTAVDGDLPGEQITYSIVGGIDAAKFVIDAASGALSFITPPNFEAPAHVTGSPDYSVIVRATDNGVPASSATQLITVTVTDVNEAPSIVSPSQINVPENTSAVLSVLALDVDRPAQSVTYSIGGGDDAARFAIDATSGALTFVTPPNFETATDADGNNIYQVLITASDNGSPSLSTSQLISVTVTDVNEAPVINSASAVSIDENSSSVLTVVAVDPDQPSQSLTYSITGGVDAGLFTIDPISGNLAFVTAPDFESPQDDNGDNVYQVIVQATDNGVPARSRSQSVAVTVRDVAPAIVSVAKVRDGSEADVATVGKIRVSQSRVTTVDTVVHYAVSGAAVAGTDYSALSGVITIPAGQLSADLDVTVIDDSIVEGIENLVLTLNGLGAHDPETQLSLLPSSLEANLGIGDDDVTTLSISNPSIVEGNSGASLLVFAITSSNAVQGGFTVPFSLANITTDGSDYSLVTAGPLAFAGDAGEVRTVTVSVNGDGVIEGTETLRVSLLPATAVPPVSSTKIISGASGVGTIFNDDFSFLTVSSPTVTEGNSGTAAMTFIVTSPTAVPGGFTVAFNVAGQTASSNDYTVVTTSPLTFSGIAGETRSITVNVVGDLNSEADERLSVTLGGVATGSPALSGGVVSGAVGTGTILNNDTVTFTVNGASGSESVGALSFNLIADKPFDADIVMAVSLTGVSATGNGVDFAGTTQLVTFLAGQLTKTISVGVINDSIVEGTETFTVSLSPSTALNGRLVNVSDTGTGTITDNDSATVSVVKLNDGIESDTPSDGAFLVSQSAVSSTDTVITYSRSGSATAGVGKDYSTLSGTVTIPAGQTSVTIPVDVLNDNLVENVETVVVTLSGFGARDPEISLNSVAANRTATVNIVDTDAPVFTSAASVSVPENTATSTTVLDVNVDTTTLVGLTVTFSLTGPDAALLRINASTGQITFRSSPDYENPADQNRDNRYEVTVIASVNSAPVRSSSQSVSITVTPVNDFTPVFDNAAPSFTIAENSGVGTVVGSVSATDADLPPQTLNYSIAAGNSSGAFTINPVTGQITVASSSPLNYEATTRFTLTVQVTDNGNPAPRTANATVTVNLSNVVESPTISIPTASFNYDFGSSYELITSDASFTYGDVASPNFNGAKLTVSLSAGRLTADVLGIVSQGNGSGQINVSNGKVYLGNTQIGTFTGGSGSNADLVITFNANATTAAVGKVIQRLSLKTNGGIGSTRTVTLQIRNISGVNSNIASRNVTVIS